MSKKYESYVCVLNCYFKALDGDMLYFKISDKELSKLMTNVEKIKFERDSNDEKIKRLQHEKHMYKVELGRCVRKLTRIYEELYAIGALLHFVYHNDCTPKDLVDSFKRL